MRKTTRVVRLGNTVVVAAAAAIPLTISTVSLAQDEPDDPGCTRVDAQLIEVKPLVTQNGKTLGRVGLWYSPSSRCVWGAATNDSGDSSTEAGQLEVLVWRRASRDLPERVTHGGTTQAGQRVIGTAAIYDAAITDPNTQALAYGKLDGGRDGNAQGKTNWF